KERRFLDNLKEYKAAIQDAWRRVSDARKTLVSGTQMIMQKDFRDMNNLIADFNREADTYNAVARSAGLETVEGIPPVTTSIKFQEPNNVDVRPLFSLSGKKYAGTIGTRKVTIEFKDGTFVCTGEISGEGRYRQGGNGVGMETETSVYRGVVSND